MLCVALLNLWFDPTRLEPTIYRTQGKHANHYATDAVGKFEEN
jgi:hypothetical protein